MSNRRLAIIDAVADSTKAELSKHRRDLEAKGYVELCSTKGCEHEAASGSCYCDLCESRWDEGAIMCDCGREAEFGHHRKPLCGSCYEVTGSSDRDWE